MIAISKNIFESAAGKILRYLLEHGEMTIKNIELGLNVTRNAVRVQIEQLLSQGILSSRLVRHNRGRPYRVYFITAKGRELLPNDYKNLARLLWREIINNENSRKRNDILKAISMKLAEEFKMKVHSNDLNERIKQFVDILNKRGIPSEINGKNTSPGWIKYNCPYYSVAKEYPDICAMDLKMMKKILGSPVERYEWMLVGAKGCKFKIKN